MTWVLSVLFACAPTQTEGPGLASVVDTASPPTEDIPAPPPPEPPPEEEPPTETP